MKTTPFMEGQNHIAEAERHLMLARGIFGKLWADEKNLSFYKATIECIAILSDPCRFQESRERVADALRILLKELKS
jgi:hypothetical protein